MVRSIYCGWPFWRRSALRALPTCSQLAQDCTANLGKSENTPISEVMNGTHAGLLNISKDSKDQDTGSRTGLVGRLNLFSAFNLVWSL